VAAINVDQVDPVFDVAVVMSLLVSLALPALPPAPQSAGAKVLASSF
jgi:hypothetical protein